MLTWMGFIAKFTEFVVSKLSSKAVDLGFDQIVLDKKGQAAKAFLSLYDSLLPLEEVIDKAIKSLNIYFVNHKSQLFIKTIIGISPEVNKVSHDFTMSLSKVHSCLYFYDPNLYSMFGHVATLKGAFLLSPLMGLHCDIFHINPKVTKKLYEISLPNNKEILPSIKSKIEESKNFDGIVYSILGEKISSLDFDDLYRNTEVITSGELHEPKFEVANILKNDVINHIFRQDDPEKAHEFLHYLEMHRNNIHDVRETLRTFIANHFSIEDLLRITH